MLYVIDPLPIGDEHMVGSNLGPNDYPRWQSGTSYPRGSRVSVMDNHKIYQSAVPVGPAPVSTVTPQSDLFNAETNPTGKWVEVGTTRRWKPFDGSIGDQAYADNLTELTWTLSPGQQADSVAFFGLHATHVLVQVMDTQGTILFAREESTVDPANIEDAWDYLSNPPVFHTEMVFRGIPLQAGQHIVLRVRHIYEIPRLGEIIIGREISIGKLLVGGGVSLQDYSRKERDDFGNAIIVRRAYSDIATYPVLVDAGRERYVLRTLGRLRSTPAVYHAGESMTGRGLTVFGFFRDVPVTLSSPTHSQLTIEVEGLV